MKAKQLLKIMKKVLSLWVIFTFTVSQIAYALPQGVEVVEGEADVTVDGNTMTIDADAGTIIDYSSFDIAENEAVVINLPDASSDILNRVIGDNISNIAGNVDCNGLFILINPNGIYVTPTANLDVGSLVLSTRDITNEDFLAKEHLFQKISEEQLDILLKNAGTINISEGGFGVLIAGAIENEGTIVAPMGKIAFASGDAVRLDITNGGLISIAIEEEVASQVLDHEGNPITDQISNTGNIDADGGVAILKAESITDVFTKVINLDGYITADTVDISADGTITLGNGGYIKASDTVIKGDKVILDSEEHVDVDVDTPNRSISSDVAPFYFYGNTTFHNLECTIPWTQVYFEPGMTYTFKDNLKLEVPDEIYASIFLQSQEKGSPWYIDVQSPEYLLQKIVVQDAHNINPENIYATPSSNWGNNVGWDLNTVVWGSAIEGNWVTDGNWVGGTAPTSLDNVQFDDSGTGDSLIDQSWSNFNDDTIMGTFVITADYSGTIKLQAKDTPTNYFMMLGDYSQAGGTFTCDISGGRLQTANMNITGGIFNCGDIMTDFSTTLGTYTQSGGTFNGGSTSTLYFHTLDLNSGAFNSTSGNLEIGGGASDVIDFTGTGTFDHNDGTIRASGGANTITIVSVGETLNNVIIGTDAGGGELYFTDEADIDGDLTVTNGGATQLDIGAQLNIAGNMNLTNLDTIGFGGGAASLVFDGTSILTSAGLTNFPAVTVGTDAAAGSLTLGDAADIAAALTIYSADDVVDLNGKALDLTGGSFSNDGTLKLEGGESLTNFTNDTTGTIEYDGGGSYSSGLVAGDAYNHLKFTGGGTWILDNNLDINGDLTVSSGTLDVKDGSNYDINIAGDANFTGGDFEERAGTVIFDGTSSLRSASETFNNIAVGTNSAGGSLTLVDTADIGGTLSFGSGGTNVLNITNRSVTYAGSTLNFANLDTFTTTGSVVSFDGTTSLTSSGKAFNKLTVSATGSVTLADSADINSTLSIASGGILDLEGQDLDLTGGTLSSSGTMRLHGNETLTNFATSIGTIEYDGSGTYSSGLTAGDSYTNLKFSGSGAWTMDAKPTVSGNLNITNGTVNMNGNELTVTGAFTQDGGVFNGSTNTLTLDSVDLNGGTFNSTSGTLSIDDTTDFTGGTFNHNSGTVRFIATNYNFTADEGAGETTFNNLIFKGVGVSSNAAVRLQDDFTVGGNLTIGNNSPTYNTVVETNAASVPTITVNGNLEFEATAGADAILGSTTAAQSVNVSLKGDFTMADSNNYAYGDVTLNDTTKNQTITQSSGNIGVGTWTINKGDYTATMADNLTLTNSGDVTISGGALATAGNDLNINGTFSNTNSGTLRIQGGETLTFTKDTDSGTVEYIGSGSTDYASLVYGNTYNTLKINSTTGNNDFSPDGTLTIGGDLDIDNGVLDINGQALSLAGGTTFTNDATLRMQGAEALTNFSNDTDTGTIVYDGTGTYASGLIAGNTYNNLTFSGTGTWTLNAALDIDGDFTNSAGTLNADGQAINVAKGWNNTGGTFTHGDNTVTFDSANTSLIEGNTTFYSLACTTGGKQLTFEAGSTQTVEGTSTLTLTGSPGNLITLRSSSAGTQWNINPTGTINVSYVDVQDSNNMNGVNINPSNSVNSGNNTNWFSSGTTKDPIIIEPPDPIDDRDGGGGDDGGGGPDGISDGDEELVEYEEGKKKYRKDYADGKYRTVVIVFEGRVIVAPYDEEGPRFDEGESLSAGEEASVEGEIKGEGGE